MGLIDTPSIEISFTGPDEGFMAFRISGVDNDITNAEIIDIAERLVDCDVVKRVLGNTGVAIYNNANVYGVRNFDPTAS